MREIFFLALLLMGYLVAVVIADFPIYPIVVGGIFYAVLVLGGVANKALLMFLTSMALVGYHFAVTLADMPLWPIQAFAGGCIIAAVISIARNKVAAGVPHE